MRKNKKPLMTIDTSFARAAQLVLAQREETHIILAGCGGTGSWLAPAIVRVARIMLDQNRQVTVTFVDPDIVEDVNLYRQNFCHAELGRNKAEALAARYAAAWGIEIGARERRFDQKLVVNFGVTVILVGCVDNPAGRRTISEALSKNNALRKGDAPQAWWLDCGNSKEHGQVLLGSTTKREHLKVAFPSPKICHALPSPALQSPDLLKAQAEEKNKKRMSCAELQAANAQSLSINQRIAAEAADYLVRMLIGPGLRKFATEIDLVTGSARSRPITPEEVCR